MAQLKKAVRPRHPEDPQLRRMLATHMHCGEEMQLVSGGRAAASGVADGKDDGGLLTYRCVCGFCFDQRRI
jgi:hypothetical protein